MGVDNIDFFIQHLRFNYPLKLYICVFVVFMILFIIVLYIAPSVFGYTSSGTNTGMIVMMVLTFLAVGIIGYVGYKTVVTSREELIEMIEEEEKQA